MDINVCTHQNGSKGKGSRELEGRVNLTHMGLRGSLVCQDIAVHSQWCLLKIGWHTSGIALGASWILSLQGILNEQPLDSLIF